MSSDPRLIKLVLPDLMASKGKTFLDIACGFGKWGCVTRKYLAVSYLVGLDVWKPYLKQLKTLKVYDDLIVGLAQNPPFIDRAFDVTMVCDVIEHMSRHEGKRLCCMIEKLAKKVIVLTTPNYRYRQGIEDNNPFEIHVSVWCHNDFKQLGYTVKGIGLKISDHLPPLIFHFLGRLLFTRMIVTQKFSRFSELIACTKNVGISS